LPFYVIGRQRSTLSRGHLIRTTLASPLLKYFHSRTLIAHAYAVLSYTNQTYSWNMLQSRASEFLGRAGIHGFSFLLLFLFHPITTLKSSIRPPIRCENTASERIDEEYVGTRLQASVMFVCARKVWREGLERHATVLCSSLGV